MEKFKDFLKKKIESLKLEGEEGEYTSPWGDPWDQEVIDKYMVEGMPEDWDEYGDWETSPDYYKVRINGEWRWISRRDPISPELQQKVISIDPGFIQGIANPTLEIQKYIIKNRPDLIKKIKNLDPSLRKSHKHELGLAGLEI
jgi:hypothetical protein